MFLQIIILLAGFLLLIKSADVFVDGASSIARNLNVSRLVIGLTIVAFGTSAPELAVSIKALMSGNGDMVIGNVIGSNIINILLIVGVSSLFCTLRVKSSTIRKELPITIMMSLLLVVLFVDHLFDPSQKNMISQSDGFVILLFFMVFIYYLFSIIRKKKEVDDPNTLEDDPKYSISYSVIFTLLGLVGVIAGSHFVVESASQIAEILGVSQRIISLTVIALGTSLPELVTSVTAAKKGEQDLLIGNIIGSNIFNIGIVLGLPVAIFGGISGVGFSYVDLILFLVSAFMIFIAASNDKVIHKKEGIIMIFTFIVYYAYIILG